MLKTIRVILALLCFVAIALLFVDVTGFAAEHWAWMASVQFIPAILALHFGIVIALILLTLLFGRLYCSVICPLGVYQDIINRISTWFTPKKKRSIGKFKYQKSRKIWRIGFLAVFVILLAAGAWMGSFIEPYSAFGRIMSQIVRPGALAANNGLADIAAAHDSVAFIHSPVPALSIPLLTIAVVTLIIVTLFAWNTGRGYCNTVCPVGTVLGFISKYAWLRPVINDDKCIRCGKCGRKCKAQCIDTKNHVIDYSRCVACFDCLGSCKEGAITYSHPHNKTQSNAAGTDNHNEKRRAFLIGGTIVASSIVAQAADGGLAPIKQKRPSPRHTPVVPPGAKSAKSLSDHCTACQLCISNCPNQVLRPSTDIATFMQPVMQFNKGFCRPECTTCSDVCPNGAIQPIDVTTKSSTKIGTAVVNTRMCISANGSEQCGNCARKCPAGAITMIPIKEGDSRLRPLVNAEACIGCGSCEYHCPVGKAGNIRGKHAAIHVEGVDVHRII